MKEENKIKLVTPSSIFAVGFALWLWWHLVSCTPKLSEHLSTKEYKEAKISFAEVVFTDSIQRFNSTSLHYQWVCRIFWQVDKDIKWVTYSAAPCPVDIGYRMPLLTKR